MEKNPQAVEKLKPLLKDNEELIWAEEFEIPRQGEGCLVFIAIIFGLAALVAFITGGLGLGLVFTIITGAMLAAFFKVLPVAAIGISAERIFLRYPEYKKIIALKKINEIKLLKGRGTNKADLKISTKVKKLNTQTYKFRIEETEQIIQNIPNYYEVIDLFNQVHLKYLNLNPPSASDIEIE